MILFYALRGIAWLGRRRRTWQAAISLGELHAGFEPKISECENVLVRECREASIRRELKHLSTGRKRNQLGFP